LLARGVEHSCHREEQTEQQRSSRSHVSSFVLRGTSCGARLEASATEP
jgi:hypothetical protein